MTLAEALADLRSRAEQLELVAARAGIHDVRSAIYAVRLQTSQAIRELELVVVCGGANMPEVP